MITLSLMVGTLVTLLIEIVGWRISGRRVGIWFLIKSGFRRGLRLSRMKSMRWA